MRSKEHFNGAAVADREEVTELYDYLARKILAKSFSKSVDESVYGLNVDSERPHSAQLSPYHYLRTDLALLLGASGSKLLNKTWSKFRLSPNETNRARLRPCLVKLFSVAARIAAPRGIGHALKRLVSDFEKAYFCVVVDQDTVNHKKTSRRFALLSVLQAGQGSHLLHGILDDPDGQEETFNKTRSSYPSGHIEQDPTVARRQFLFEAAYRAKSWSDAYRQARVLKCWAPKSNRHKAVNRRLGRVAQGVLGNGCPGVKKKQLLSDLACLSELALHRRIEFCLDALGSRHVGCRPGQLERTALELIAIKNPWWKVSLNRLYRHLPVPERWTDDLRTLCQSEPSLRGFCRVVLNTLRYSGQRAHYNLSRNGLGQTCFPLVPNLSKARMNKVRRWVLWWKSLLPSRPDPETVTYGAPLQLTSEDWSFIFEICAILEMEAPNRAMSRNQAQPARVWHSVLCLSPEFGNCSPAEQRFLLARTLFRSACGLDDLERQAVRFSTPEKILHRALDYAEWSGHRAEMLEEFRQTKPGQELAQTALEETFWSTGDPVYQKFALMCQHGGWCPLFDREGDLFAACFSDLVSASQALVKVCFWGQHISQVCHNQGLAPLLSASRECPVLCLRLQTLWMSVADEVQRNHQMKFLAISRNR